MSLLSWVFTIAIGYFFLYWICRFFMNWYRASKSGADVVIPLFWSFQSMFLQLGLLIHIKKVFPNLEFLFPSRQYIEKVVLPKLIQKNPKIKWIALVCWDDVIYFTP